MRQSYIDSLVQVNKSGNPTCNHFAVKQSGDSHIEVLPFTTYYIDLLLYFQCIDLGVVVVLVFIVFALLPLVKS